MSRKFYDQVSTNEGLKKEVAAALQSVVKDKMPRSKPEIRELVEKVQRDPKLRTQLSTAISGVAKKHGVTFDGQESYDGELSEAELELIAGGPTAVEYAVMLALIIVVCLAAITFLGTQSSGTSWSNPKTI